MTYQELHTKQQQEVDNFPLGFAFSDKQFEEMMNKWGFDAKNKEDLKKIVSIGAGGFIRKQDIQAFNEMADRHVKEIEELRKNENEFIEALVYQLHNHEYGYSRDEADIESAIAALGLSWDDVDAQKHPYNHKCLIQAIRRVIKEYNEAN